MPSRNILKIDIAETYYHVYARGASKQSVFIDNFDYGYFLSLLARYLSKAVAKDKVGVVYPNYYGKIELLAYCLMPNHLHLFLYQNSQRSMEGLMRSVMTSYSRYFNLKYKRSGSLFESRYKASGVSTDAYLQHISRYIHLNPRSWKHYPYSSLTYYCKGNEPEWLRTARIMSIFDGNRDSYLEFVADYETHKQILDTIKGELADY